MPPLELRPGISVRQTVLLHARARPERAGLPLSGVDGTNARRRNATRQLFETMQPELR